MSTAIRVITIQGLLLTGGILHGVMFQELLFGDPQTEAVPHALIILHLKALEEGHVRSIIMLQHMNDGGMC
jgi:hypothetical protein